jgi:hypothetical protein
MREPTWKGHVTSGSRTGCLENKRPFEVHCGLAADVLDPAMPFCTQVVEAKAIGVRLNQLAKSLTESDPLCGFHLYLKNRKLNPLTVIATGPGYFAQTPLAVYRSSTDVIGDKNHHVPSHDPEEQSESLFPKERWIAIKITT